MSRTIVFLGLSITSSWGNGHATTYRGLLRELAKRGNEVVFLERDMPWYAASRDLPEPPYGRTHLYRDLAGLRRQYAGLVRDADAVIVGSYVPDGVAVCRWVLDNATGMTGFYDIDTPVTLAMLEQGQAEYLAADLVPSFDVYLSFAGGPTLRRLEREFGARKARALYCSVDASHYYPETVRAEWDLGYLGTFSADRQRKLERMMLRPARQWPEGRFVVAGPQYPQNLHWPANLSRIEHLPPDAHRRFYNRQRFTLNLTRGDMVKAGWSPSVRLFEAAACSTPIISDPWPGLETLFAPGREVLIAHNQSAVLGWLRDMPEAERRAIGAAARNRVLAEHTAAHRARELEMILDGIEASEGDRHSTNELLAGFSRP